MKKKICNRVDCYHRKTRFKQLLKKKGGGGGGKELILVRQYKMCGHFQGKPFFKWQLNDNQWKYTYLVTVCYNKTNIDAFLVFSSNNQDYAGRELVHLSLLFLNFMLHIFFSPSLCFTVLRKCMRKTIFLKDLQNIKCCCCKLYLRGNFVGVALGTGAIFFQASL